MRLAAVDRPAELAHILRELAASDELAHRLREGARETPVLTPRAHAEAVRSVYHEAIADAVHREPVAAAGGELEFLHGASVKVGFAAT